MKKTFQNDLFLRAATGEVTERTPVWMMRQAGRILPEYRAVRERLSGFKELCTTPALAAEVTVQPVDLLGVDAAIIFSDILVIPEAMGLDYDMEEKRGPVFPRTVGTAADIEALRTGDDAAAHLQYVYDAIQITVKELNGRVPLIGFAGAPWTIFSYMVQGSGSKTFDKARRMLYAEPEMSHRLLQKITDSTISYLRAKVAAGCDLVQVFDSWAGILSPELYAEFATPYIGRIVEALQPHAPVTVFAKGAFFALEDFNKMPCSVIGLDWHTSPAFARNIVGGKRVLQGNFDPAALYASPEQVYARTKTMLAAFGPHHIANLGHGVYPDTPLDSVKAFLSAVKGS